jgi:glutamate synthase (NADPH) large chain
MAGNRQQKRGLYDPAYEKDSCGIGFVADIAGRPSHRIVQDGLTMLLNMSHRGARGADQNTGDGAGILVGLPHEFLKQRAARDLGIELPGAGAYGAGLVFLPRGRDAREHAKRAVEAVTVEEGQRFLGWRPVPTDGSSIGAGARAGEPVIEQVLIGAAGGIDAEDFERRLYVIRKVAGTRIASSPVRDTEAFYVCSLSSRVIVYKGQLTPEQVPVYFPDLSDPAFASHLAMIHSRFSTNTFPSWDRAQPMRFLCHNGEINTLMGNKNWMRARQGTLRSSLLKEDLGKLFPIVDYTSSDSGMLDNVLELLIMAGRSLPHAIMTLIPEAWENHSLMSPEKRAFYEYHSCLMEPWDGPASVAFSDGRYIGAVLDRNGLRPSRYYVTHDGRVVMASEVGVLPIAPENIKSKGRLQPGRMFLVDFQEQRIVDDEELKLRMARANPYALWLDRQRITLQDVGAGSPTALAPSEHEAEPRSQRIDRMTSFGYTTEHLEVLLKPMAEDGQEPLSSMGNDTPLACLSDKPRLLYDYFKQLFAQVTNPPIDSIREAVIMSLQCYVGPEQNLLEPDERACHRLLLPSPLLGDAQLSSIRAMDYRGWRSLTVDTTYPAADGEAGLARALDRICAETDAALDAGYQIVILSDRRCGRDRVPVSALLATGAVHHHMVRNVRRTRVGLIVESGEPREVHHYCMLVGYGADAVNPYLAHDAIRLLNADGDLAGGMSDDDAISHYHKAIEKGMRKVFGKMGISTLQSYKGAQIFEAVGLHEHVVERCFAGTASRVQGVGFDILAREALMRHAAAWPTRPRSAPAMLNNPGDFHWREGGERHMWSPDAIAYLQKAVRLDDVESYRQFAEIINDRERSLATLRGIMKLRESNPVSLSDVEPASAIVRRFCTGAMSYGSISQEAHETLAIAMNRLGGRSNTGEGGELSERYVRLPNGDSKRSSIKQVASGRFGVTSWYLTNADEHQIKMAQGAKPGEGGELPGHKVYPHIAKVRFSTPGVELISPPPHHDIYSIEDLAELIYDLKNANPSARISVKLVSEVGVGTIAAGVAKGHADHILISGHDGGTGASPLTGIKHAGLPWELGLSETHQTLVLNDLRSRVILQTDGHIKTGRDVVIAALLGAEEMGFSTGPLVSLGCTLMRKCHKNTCPFGIATQDPVLRERFEGDPAHVIRYFTFVAEEARTLMAKMGFRTMDEMIGRVDMLEPDPAVVHWKARTLDLLPILTPALRPHENTDVHCTRRQEHGLERALDNKLIEIARPALERGTPVRQELVVRNVNRAVGTMLSHHISRRHGENGLPDGTIHFKLTGSAGQSFGAWLAHGVTLELEGDCNDYAGKGLSGGRLIVYPPRTAAFVPQDNIIAGNVTLYGATSGSAYFRGMAAERFCVRNSGARVVIEGVGDHGCEYMTGGRVAILGDTGRNFAAGMSGGIAYVWDREGRLEARCNTQMVELAPVEDPERADELRQLIEEHAELTGSEVARQILADWRSQQRLFVQVIPTAYRQVLEQQSSKERVAVKVGA